MLADAVRGADAVFVNIGAIPTGLGDLLAAAHDAGVSKIVMLSSTTVLDQDEQVHALGTQHKVAEDAIKASGIDWTILRCGGFATNTLGWAPSVRAEAAQLLSGSLDGSVVLWNLQTGEVIKKLVHGGPVTSVAVRPDGKRWASAGQNSAAR